MNINNLNGLDNLDDSFKLTDETRRIGIDILNELEYQNNLLEKSNETLESNEYILNHSMRILRKMSWTGMFLNFLWTEPIQTKPILSMSENNITLNEQDELEKINNTNNEKTELFSNRQNEKILNQNQNQTQEECLRDLEKKITELYEISTELGIQVQKQNIMLEQIETNAEIVEVKTLQINLETNNLTKNITSNDFILIGKFSFVDVKTGMVLGIDKKEPTQLVFCNQFDMETIFQCWKSTSNPDVHLVQSFKTLKYLQVGWTGYIGMSGMNSNSNAHCFIILEENYKTKTYKKTGIALLSKNMYWGGWLKNPISETNQIVYTTKNLTKIKNILMLQPIKLD